MYDSRGDNAGMLTGGVIMGYDKPKRDLLFTIHRIECFHRRRMILVDHAVLSVVAQVLLWVNWYASYAVLYRGCIRSAAGF